MHYAGVRRGRDSRSKRGPHRAEHIMNALLVICMSVCAPLAAVGLYNLQVHLERWDYDRHAED